MSLALICALWSCSQEQTEPQITTTPQGNGRLELTAGITVDFPVDQEGLRSLDIYQRDLDGDGAVDEFKYEIDIERYKEKKMTLFLKRKGSNKVTRVEAPVVITKTGENYSMRITAEGIQPNGVGLDFASGEWYITGFWGGGTQDTSVAHNPSYQVADIAPVSPMQIGDKTTMDIPLGFPWTRITGSQKGSTYVLEHFNLQIKPMGVLLCVIPENRTIYTIDLVKMDRALEGFAIGGTFQVGNSTDAELTAGDFPAFSTSIGENLGNQTVNVLPRTLQIESGRKADAPVYIWAIPTAKTVDGYGLSFNFVSSERTTTDSSLDAADRFDTNGVGKFVDRYTVDLSFTTAPKHGQYFIRSVKLRSSPMITEYFVNRVRNGARLVGETGEGAFNHPYFFGYVELYNPNLDAIALDNYALARISNIRNTLGVRNLDGTVGRTYDHNSPYWHPLAMEKFVTTFGAQQTGTADRYATPYTESHRALLLSLQLKNGEKSNFQPNSLGFISPLENGTSTASQKLVANPENDNRIERVHFYKGAIASGARPYLGGGKTMVLLGNAFLESGTSYNPASPNEIRVTPLPSATWQRMMSDPECQIIAAVDNYTARNLYAIEKGSGVMNIGWHDALVLVQKHGQDGSKRRVVDATSAHPFARVNNWKEFAEKVTLASSTDTGWPHYRVRTVAQRMPEFLNFSHSQWHSTYHGSATHIPPKVSPGRRSAAGL